MHIFFSIPVFEVLNCCMQIYFVHKNTLTPIMFKKTESEMKGLDKPLKKEEDRSLKDATPRLVSPVMATTTFVPSEKKISTSPIKLCIPDSLPKKMTESPAKPVTQDSTKLLSPKLENLEDDVYEFKEPEPFDFGEMRARKDVRVKPTMGTVSSEDSDPEGKMKKKGRPRKDMKDGDSDKTESDSDSSPSPQKRLILQTSDRHEGGTSAAQDTLMSLSPRSLDGVGWRSSGCVGIPVIAL